MKKVSLMFILSMVLSLPGHAWGSDTEGIVYVDLQKALIMSDAGKEAKEKFAQKVNKAQKKIEVKQGELGKLKESIEKKGLLLSEEAREEKEKEYQKELRDYQRFVRDSQEELKGEEAEMSKKIIRELGKVIERMGKEGKYTLILGKNTSGILYASDTIDISDEVIKAYNEQKRE